MRARAAPLGSRNRVYVGPPGTCLDPGDQRATTVGTGRARARPVKGPRRCGSSQRRRHVATALRAQRTASNPATAAVTVRVSAARARSALFCSRSPMPVFCPRRRCLTPSLGRQISPCRRSDRLRCARLKSPNLPCGKHGDTPPDAGRRPLDCGADGTPWVQNWRRGTCHLHGKSRLGEHLEGTRLGRSRPAALSRFSAGQQPILVRSPQTRTKIHHA